MEVSLLSGGSQRTLETVKLLHETILALKTALDGSRKELLELRNQNLISKPIGTELDDESKELIDYKRVFVAEPMDNSQDEEDRDKFKKVHSQDDDKLDSGAESDDIDDIELVFTTGETDPSSIHEDLVPIVEEHVRRSLTSTAMVETDISKCGIIDELEASVSTRRNTLPNPLPYQPIIHREILAATRLAPVRSPYKALQPGTQDMGAQTDITALPTQWKSETSLAHKISCNLMTLPSKFTLPVPQAKRLPLSDKTREARRVLLSDINFTSMVPELSRSADHLSDDKVPPKIPPCSYDTRKSPRTEKCCEYMRQDSRSSCGSYYGSRCYTSSASIPPFACGGDSSRRHSWKPPVIMCCRSRQVWSSVPSSPLKCPYDEGLEESFCHLTARKRRSKVHFHHCGPCGQSLPNLRLDPDSGESTDSLLDEAEEFLRNSIDNMIITRSHISRRERRASDADSMTSFEPPRAAQPFLPKTVKDLKHDYFVKVITPEGRIAVGRVRYCGLVPGKAEPYVGVELLNDSGFSDGTFLGHQFFNCEPGRGLFVPFKKVVIAWSV